MHLGLIRAAILSITAVATPALADVTHHFSGRFGVSYQSDPNNPGGTAQPLYEGTYTARFSHQTDSGVRFRFDLGVALSNFDSRRPPQSLSDPDRR